MHPTPRFLSLSLLLAGAAFASQAHARSDASFMKEAAHAGAAEIEASKKVSLPDGPSMKHKAELKLIDAGDNDKFDERYARNFGVKAHEDTIKLFEEAARDAKDPEVKAFAQKTLPGLKHHLEMARALPMADTKK